MKDLEFVVWQFVRLMVALEAREKTTGRTPETLATWRDLWTQVDEDLARLGETDADGFAEMMMETTVTLEDVAPAARREIAAVLAALLADMQAAIDNPATDLDQRDALMFERRELRGVLERVRG